MEAHVRLAELAARAGRREEAGEHAALVRGYWGEVGGQGQPLVDNALDRLQRIVPAGS
jgi:hypothetical protein